MPSDPLYLCHAADLAEGQARGFDPTGSGRDTLFVVRHQDRLHAYADACPHYGDTPLPWRRHAYLNANASRIVCAAHGAQFDIASGECTLGPCLGQFLRRLALEVTLEGQVFLRDAGDLPSNQDHAS